MELQIDSAADQNILRALREKEARQAARLMVDYYGVAVFAECRRIVGDEEAAEDLTQETFSRVFGALPAPAGRDSVREWLLAAARATCAGHDAPREAPVDVGRSGGGRVTISESLRRRLEMLAAAL